MVRAVVEDGLSKAAAARQFNTTPKTVGKWIKRFRAEGVDGLHDRSSRPLSSPGQTPAATCAAVENLRRQRRTGKQIAAELGTLRLSLYFGNSPEFWMNLQTHYDLKTAKRNFKPKDAKRIKSLRSA